MRRRVIAVVATLAMVLGACTGDESASTTSSTSSTVPASTTSTSMPPVDSSGDVILRPNGPVFIADTDRGPLVAALQFLLVCTGFDRPRSDSPEMIIDGIYGPITSQAVAYAQASTRKIPTGEVDEETFADLSRRCDATRELRFADGETTTSVAGNVAPGDDEVYAVALLADQRVSVEARSGDVSVIVENSEGDIVKSADEPLPWSGIAPLDAAYRIRVVSTDAPTSYVLEVEIPEVPAVTIDFGPMRLGPNGLGLSRFGEGADDVIEVLTFVLGPPTEDSGWEVGREGGAICEGTNRHLTWVIQPGASEGTTAATLTVDFSDIDGARAFAQYSYRSDAPDQVDTGARALATLESVTIGSTLDQFVTAYGEPNFFNADLGLTGFNNGMVAGITAAAQAADDEAGADDGDEPVRYVWYIGAGEDGCLDFRN